MIDGPEPLDSGRVDTLASVTALLESLQVPLVIDERLEPGDLGASVRLVVHERVHAGESHVGPRSVVRAREEERPRVAGLEVRSCDEVFERRPLGGE